MLPFHAVVPFFTDACFLKKFSPKRTVWGSPVSTEVALHLSPLVARVPPAPRPTDGPDEELFGRGSNATTLVGSSI